MRNETVRDSGTHETFDGEGDKAADDIENCLEFTAFSSCDCSSLLGGYHAQKILGEFPVQNEHEADR